MTDKKKTIPDSIRGRLPEYAALAVILLLAVLLRLYRLGEPALWIDELVTSWHSDWSFSAGSPSWFPSYASFYFLTWLFTKLGPTDFLLRLPSCLFGIASVWITYRLGRHLFDRYTGILAALLMAVAPFQVLHSQNARYYAVLTFYGGLYLLISTRLLEKPGKIRLWIFLIPACLLTALAHPVSYFWIAISLLFIFVSAAIQLIRERLGMEVTRRLVINILAVIAVTAIVFQPAFRGLSRKYADKFRPEVVILDVSAAKDIREEFIKTDSEDMVFSADYIRELEFDVEVPMYNEYYVELVTKNQEPVRWQYTIDGAPFSGKHVFVTKSIIDPNTEESTWAVSRPVINKLGAMQAFKCRPGPHKIRIRLLDLGITVKQVILRPTKGLIQFDDVFLNTVLAEFLPVGSRGTAFLIISAVLIITGLVLAFISRWQAALFLFLWCVFPIYLFTFIKPIHSIRPRYLILLMCPLAIFAAAPVGTLIMKAAGKLEKRLVRTGMVWGVIIIVSALFIFLQYKPLTEYHRSRISQESGALWNELASYLDSETDPDDLVVSNLFKRDRDNRYLFHRHYIHKRYGKAVELPAAVSYLKYLIEDSPKSYYIEFSPHDNLPLPLNQSREYLRENSKKLQDFGTNLRLYEINREDRGDFQVFTPYHVGREVMKIDKSRFKNQKDNGFDVDISFSLPGLYKLRLVSDKPSDSGARVSFNGLPLTGEAGKGDGEYLLKITGRPGENQDTISVTGDAGSISMIELSCPPGLLKKSLPYYYNYDLGDAVLLGMKSTGPVSGMNKLHGAYFYWYVKRPSPNHAWLLRSATAPKSEKDSSRMRINLDGRPGYGLYSFDGDEGFIFCDAVELVPAVPGYYEFAENLMEVSDSLRAKYKNITMPNALVKTHAFPNDKIESMETGITELTEKRLKSLMHNNYYSEAPSFCGLMAQLDPDNIEKYREQSSRALERYAEDIFTDYIDTLPEDAIITDMQYQELLTLSGYDNKFLKDTDEMICDFYFKYGKNRPKGKLRISTRMITTKSDGKRVNYNTQNLLGLGTAPPWEEGKIMRHRIYIQLPEEHGPIGVIQLIIFDDDGKYSFGDGKSDFRTANLNISRD